MSDTDDGFDKEAEREKLREKYEADEKDREATQQMSELLLQGATMTNKHCDACGNPKFRYEGTTFCANCDGGAGDASADAETGSDAPADQSAQQKANPRQEVTQQEPTRQGTTAQKSGQPTPASSNATPESNSRSEPTAPRSTPASEPAQNQTGNAQRESAPTPSAAGDLDAARESVRTTLTDLAARAERSTDAAHTRELLAATKEAAETLRELNRLE